MPSILQAERFGFYKKDRGVDFPGNRYQKLGEENQKPWPIPRMSKTHQTQRSNLKSYKALA
jgi:hypothetical protein